MKSLGLALALFTVMAVRPLTAVSPDAAIKLWPKTAPGENGEIGIESDTTGPTGALVGGRRVIRLGNVSVPTLTVYRPLKGKDTGAAVLVFPGGGYSILALDLEGAEICEWLNSIGVTGILVKYRVPARAGLPKWAAPLQDAQRALGMVRKRASEFGVDPKRIGVLGFSAGGHLAAAASTNFDRRTYDAVDEADTVNCRPDFCLLIYPAYLTVKEDGDKVAPELRVTGETPRLFLSRPRTTACEWKPVSSTMPRCEMPKYPPKCTSIQPAVTDTAFGPRRTWSPPGLSVPRSGCVRWEYLASDA